MKKRWIHLVLWLYCRAKECDLNWPLTSPLKLWPAETHAWILDRSGKAMRRMGATIERTTRSFDDLTRAMRNFNLAMSNHPWD